MLESGGRTSVVVPARTADPARMSLLDHLLFGLKHEGVALEILDALFEAAPEAEMTQLVADAVRGAPTSKYVRRLFWLYEHLTSRRVPVDDIEKGNYVPLLDPSDYFTGPPERSRRHRVDVNLLGDITFAPIVRRSALLSTCSAEALRAKLDGLLGAFDADALRRAISYLYTKETLSSFEIERERPPKDRAERFIALLSHVDAHAPMTERRLLELQRVIVDPRFAADGWRAGQVYVGEALDWTRERVHFVAPKPDDVSALMASLLTTMERLERSSLDPVIYAALCSFAFVFVHPFEDGNGRLHRFLIHHALARRGLTQPGVIVPVSAVMLARRAEYDAALEALSRPLMQLLDYDVDDAGRLTVRGESLRHYRFFDATPMAEALYRWLEIAIEEDMRAELDFVVRFRAAKAAARSIVDMPDRLLTLFIKLVTQNDGELSARKREAHFDMLEDDEVERLQAAVVEAFQSESQVSS